MGWKYQWNGNNNFTFLHLVQASWAKKKKRTSKYTPVLTLTSCKCITSKGKSSLQLWLNILKWGEISSHIYLLIFIRSRGMRIRMGKGNGQYKQKLDSPNTWRFYVLGFGDGGRRYEPRNTGDLKKLEETRNGPSGIPKTCLHLDF